MCYLYRYCSDGMQFVIPVEDSFIAESKYRARVRLFKQAHAIRRV